MTKEYEIVCDQCNGGGTETVPAFDKFGNVIGFLVQTCTGCGGSGKKKVLA